MLEKMNESQQNSCDNCHKEQAAGYCKQCSMLLCQSCIDTHNKWGNFTSHQILGVEDVTAAASKLVPLKELPTMECSSHGKPLEVYCDTCDKLVCHFCTVKHHRDHECDTITDTFPRHQQQILDSLQQVKEKLAVITTAVQDLERKEGFLEQVKAMRREIEVTVQHLIQLLQESEKQLMKELDQVTDAYVQKISARKKEADLTIAQLRSCKDFAEEELRIGSQQEIVVMKGQMVERMKIVCSNVEDHLRPVEETSVRFAKRSNVLEACRCLGSVIRYGRFKTTCNKTCFDLCNAGSNAPISSELVTCKLSPVADPTVVFWCVIHQDAPGSFEVHYSPPTAGLHQLMVQVGGTDILNTPLAVEVMPRKPGKIFPDLSNPVGVAITRGGRHLVVAEYNNSCVTILNIASKQKLRSYGHLGGQVEFNNPQGIAVTQDGRIFVADYNNHCVQVLTVEGSYQATIGSDGSQFKYPIDVAVHYNGNIFVTERSNHRVQVLNADFSYSHCFGSNGAQPGEFDNPIGIAIDAYGKVYIADSRNNRIQKFTTEGELLAVFTDKGEGGDRLNDPCGLCFDGNGILYVTERANKTVCMFSNEGQFLGYIGDSDGSSFQRPLFIISDKTGQLYISDTGKVVTY